MCFDRRFPWLFRLDTAPGLEPQERRRAAQIADEVCRRTGTQCVWDAGRGHLHFYYGEPDRTASSFPYKPRRETVAARVTEADIDDVVRIIQMGKLSRAMKDRVAVSNEQIASHENEEKKGRFFEENRKDALDYAGFLDRKRRGTAKVSA